MVTLKDIAERCNVTTATVSNIINGKSKASDETRDKVLAVVKEMGYQPNVIARGLRGKTTKTVGIILEDITLFTAPKIVVSIMNYFAEHGYHSIIENMRFYMRQGDGWTDESRLEYKNDMAETFAKMRAMKVDGLIFVACHSRIIDVIPQDPGFPVVLAYAYSENNSIPQYVLDDEECSYEVVKYLIENGHRKIGLVAGANDNLHTKKRILSYQKALFDNDIPYNPEYVFSGKWDRESGKKGAAELIDKGVTAIYCMNDELAGGAYDAVMEKGLKIPDDISVVGHDDRELASYLYPKLTTVELPLYDIGFRSARRIVNIIEGRSKMDGSINVIPCFFRKRGSVSEAKEVTVHGKA